METQPRVRANIPQLNVPPSRVWVSSTPPKLVPLKRRRSSSRPPTPESPQSPQKTKFLPLQIPAKGIYSQTCGKSHKPSDDESLRQNAILYAPIPISPHLPSSEVRALHDPPESHRYSQQLFPRTYHFKANCPVEILDRQATISPSQTASGTRNERFIPIRRTTVNHIEELDARFSAQTEQGPSCDQSKIDILPRAEASMPASRFVAIPQKDCRSSSPRIGLAPLVLKPNWKGRTLQRSQATPRDTMAFTPCISSSGSSLPSLERVDSSSNSQSPVFSVVPCSLTIPVTQHCVEPLSDEKLPSPMCMPMDIATPSSPLEYMPTPVSPSREISISPSPDMESQMSISSNEDQKEICVQSPRFQVPHTPISPISPSTLPKLPAASERQFNVIKSIPGQSSSRSPSPTVGSDAAVSRSPRMIFDSPSLRQVDADESDHGVVDMDISPETTPSGGLMLTLGPSAPSPPSTKRTATRSPTPNEPDADDVKRSLPESGYAMMTTDLDALRRRFLEAMEAAEKRSREVHEAKNLTLMEACLFDGDLSEEDDTLSEMSSPGLGMSHNRALKVSSSLFSPHTDSPCKDGKRQSSNRSTCRQILTPTSQSASPLLPARPIVFETIYSPRTIAPMRVAGSAMYPVVSQKTSDPVVGSVPHGYRTSASYSGCIRFLGEPAQQLPNADCDLTQEEEDILNGNTLVALSLLDRFKKA